MKDMVDWCKLPSGLISKIAENVEQVEDFVVFSCVCSSWRANAVKENWRGRLRFPWLKVDNNLPNGVWGFYDLPNKRMFHFATPTELRGRVCWGSSSGWICGVLPDTRITLHNPLSRAQIILPPTTVLESPAIWWSRCHNVCNMNLFKDTDHNDHRFLVVALVDRPHRLCFIRPGDKDWTTIADSNGPFSKFTVIKGQIFAADSSGNIYVSNSTDESPKLVLFALNSRTPFAGPTVTELVNCFDRLFVITRYIIRINDMWKTESFSVQQVDLETKEWVVVEAFQDYAIFLGVNSAMVLLASEVAGFEPNKIYFFEVRYVSYAAKYGSIHIGDFNMADKTFRSHYSNYKIQSQCCRPFWNIPSLY